MLTGNDPISIADIGSGPCDTLVKYLTGVKFDPGFKVRATDYSIEYTDERNGEALATLAAAKSAGTLKLVDFSARAGDSFAGHLLDLLGSHHAPARPHEFGIVFASHVLYHCETAGSTERLIEDVSRNVLADDGICILYHLAKVPLSFQDFRARYGSNSGGGASSPAIAITRPSPTSVRARHPCLAARHLHRRSQVSRSRTRRSGVTFAILKSMSSSASSIPQRLRI